MAARPLHPSGLGRHGADCLAARLPAICQAAHRLLRSGFNPLLLVTERRANFGSVRERARRLGFGALEVTDERALKNWQAGQRR